MNNHDIGTPAWAVRGWLREAGLQYSGGDTAVFPEQHVELNFQGLNSFKPFHCGEQ